MDLPSCLHRSSTPSGHFPRRSSSPSSLGCSLESLEIPSGRNRVECQAESARRARPSEWNLSLSSPNEERENLCLSLGAKELPDGLNYGLFFPSVNGRVGKFLEEWRTLGEYPLQGPVCSLEVSSRRRRRSMC